MYIFFEIFRLFPIVNLTKIRKVKNLSLSRYNYIKKPDRNSVFENHSSDTKHSQEKTKNKKKDGRSSESGIGRRSKRINDGGESVHSRRKRFTRRFQDDRLGFKEMEQHTNLHRSSPPLQHFSRFRLHPLYNLFLLNSHLLLFLFNHINPQFTSLS